MNSEAVNSEAVNSEAVDSTHGLRQAFFDGRWVHVDEIERASLRSDGVEIDGRLTAKGVLK